MMYEERTVIDPIERVKRLEAQLKEMEACFAEKAEMMERRCVKAEEDSKYWQMRCDEIEHALKIRNAQLAVVQMIFTGEMYDY